MIREIDIDKRWRPALEEMQLGHHGRRMPTVYEEPLTIPAAYQAIRIISQTLASLPVRVFQRMPNGTRVERPDHAAARVLSLTPNRAMGPMVFRETMQAHCLGWGNCFSRVAMSNRGDVSELVPYHPSMVKLDPEYRLGETPVYIVYTDDGEIRVPASQMIHVPALGSMGVWGYSPISLFRTAFALAKETEDYGKAFFENGASPGGVLIHPNSLSEEAAARLKETWSRTYGGTAANRHKLAILEEGMKYEAISLNPEDAQFLETRKFQLSDIARIYNVPPHMLGDLERATFSNIEHQGIEFVRYTLRPWAVRWEEELTRKLFTRRDMFVEFDFDGLLRGDTQSRYGAYSQAITDGWMSRNEVRRKENMEPMEGLDAMLVPLNMGVAQEDGSVEDPQADETDEEPVVAPDPVEEPEADAEDERSERMHRIVEVLRPCLMDPVSRVCRAAADKRRRAAKSGRLDDWMQKHREGFPPALLEAVHTPAWSVLQAAWPEAPEFAREAIGVRITMTGRGAVNEDTPDQEWIVDLLEAAILDICKEVAE